MVTQPARARSRAMRPAAHTDVRAANSSLLLRTLMQDSPCSRADLVRTTGLAKATVSALVADLLSRGLLTEAAPSLVGQVGRPSTSLRLGAGRLAGLSVEISPHALALVSVDLLGDVTRRQLVPLEADPADAPAVLSQAAHLLAGALTDLRQAGAWVPALTLAQTGVIDYDDGVVRLSSALGWHGVPVRALLSAELSRLVGPVPAVLVENDARLAALATYRTLGDPQVHDLLYLSGGDGVGAGIVSDGRVLRGWLGESGEVGHMPLAGGSGAGGPGAQASPDGGLCGCGRRGCWETVVGLGALTAALPASSPARDRTLPLTERITQLRRAYESGQPGLDRPLEAASQALGRGLATLTAILNPQVIVLSGWLAAFGDVLLEPARSYLASRQLDPAASVRVEVSTLGTWAPAIGGALMALEPALRDPGSVPLTTPAS